MTPLERHQGLLQNFIFQNQSVHQEMFQNQQRERMNKRKSELFIIKEGKDKKRVEGEVKLGSNENSPDASKEESKTSQVEKAGYIHVRARRGQATDSHSLAERARREKISRKMKCLKELVPGCNKVNGETGMLDEIINYVQSLQREVEFLSMKLAALDAREEFSIDNFPTKELPNRVTGSPAATVSLEAADDPYSLLSLVHQQSLKSQLGLLNGPLQTLPEKSTRPCLSTPELCPHSSCFSQLEALPSWDTDLQSFSNVRGFH